MAIVKSADCTETITATTKMVTACVTAVPVRLIHIRGVKKMTDDTISRAAAIDEFLTELTKRERTSLLHTWSTVEVKYFIAKILEQLPSAQPEITLESAINYLHSIGWMQTHDRILKESVQEWIPVTEQLPEDDEEVIVSCTDDSGDSEFSYTTVGWHYKGLWVVNNDRCYFVKAWMPLPTPYREGGRDGEN